MSDKKRKGGRPSNQCKRKNKLTIYLTDQEKEELEAKAKGARLPASHFVRISIAKHELKQLPEINLKHYTELSKLAGNFNQFMKAVNEGYFPSVNMKDLIRTYNTVQEIRLAIIGAKP